MDPITELLTRGVVDCIVREDLEKKLRSGKKLRVKLGCDPSGTHIHLGNAIPIWGLKRFQDLGHEIIFIVGDITGQIGDTSDKESERKQLTPEQVAENMQGWKEQVAKILDMNKVEFVYNSQWLNKLTFADVANLASKFTVAQMLERDNYRKRYEAGKPIGLHEFLYPLMQGYDSVAVKADVELGGYDQLFNVLAGRPLQEAHGQVPQNILTFDLLLGTDGRKMSKSYGNVINITDTPKEMFGKTMSMQDELIIQYFTLCTQMPLSEIEKIEADLAGGMNPRDAKVLLGKTLVTLYHSEEAAEHAATEFFTVFSKGGLPDDIETVALGVDTVGIIDLVVQQNMVTTKSEARRLIDGGGIQVAGEKVGSHDMVLTLGTDPLLIQVGKRKFLYVKK